MLLFQFLEQWIDGTANDRFPKPYPLNFVQVRSHKLFFEIICKTQPSNTPFNNCVSFYDFHLHESSPTSMFYLLVDLSIKKQISM